MSKIETVLGPISPDKLGITLLHEHIFLYNQPILYGDPEELAKDPFWNEPISLENLGDIRCGKLNRDNLVLDDEVTVTEEIKDYINLGGKSIVENTNLGLGPDPVKLKSVAEKIDGNIIATTGFYKQSQHPPWVKNKTIDELSEFMLKEIYEGIGETNIKAGSIGECACTEPVPYHPQEEKILRAACRTQKQSNVGFTFHPSIYDSKTGKSVKVGEKYIDLIEQEGANKEKFYLSHADLSLPDLKYHRKLLDRGITLSYDSFGSEIRMEDTAFMGGLEMPSDMKRIEAIAILCNEGYEKQLVMSHDVGSKMRWRRKGGMGYCFVLAHVIKALKMRGVTQRQIDTMLIETPKRILTF